MRIAWIGGLDRNEAELTRMAERAGHVLEFHPGHVGGRGAGEVRAAIARADFVIVLTDVNSHGAVGVAKKTARELGRGLLLTRRCGSSRFQQLLDAFASNDDRLRAAS